MSAKEQWYQDEADRLIRESLRGELVEILRVRDSACALYATVNVLFTDDFPDSDVVTWLDKSAFSVRESHIDRK